MRYALRFPIPQSNSFNQSEIRNLHPQAKIPSISLFPEKNKASGINADTLI